MSIVAALSLARYGYASKASDLYRQAEKFEKAGKITQAYLLYSEAAALEPANTHYLAKTAALQGKADLIAALAAKAKLASAPPATLPVSPEPDPQFDLSTVTDFELLKARRALPPAEVKLPNGRFDFHLNGDAKDVFTQVGERCRLQVQFDGDYSQTPQKVRFDLIDSDCREALHAAESATASFVVPLSSKLIFVSKDTAAKRLDNEQTMSVVLPIPTAWTAQEITEIAQAIKQVTGVEKLAWDSATNEILIRDRVSRVLPAIALAGQLTAYRGNVVIELRFIQVSDTDILSYGVNLTNSFSIVYGGNFLNAQGAQAQSVAAAAANTVSAAVKLLGQGKTLFGISALNASVVAKLTQSSARTLLDTQLRAASGMPATFHVGNKYPVLTSGYFGPASASTGGTVYTPPPSFTYQDLGISLKVTPIIGNDELVTLDVDSEYQLLAGAAIDGIPILANRKLASRISIRNDEWAIVGGLMDSTDNKSTSGVAGLARIPLLGWLFKTQNREKDHDHVLILIKPHIVGEGPGNRVIPSLRVGTETRPLSPI